MINCIHFLLTFSNLYLCHAFSCAVKDDDLPTQLVFVPYTPNCPSSFACPSNF